MVYSIYSGFRRKAKVKKCKPFVVVVAVFGRQMGGHGRRRS